MLEVAITSLKCALRDDYPEFKEFFEEKPWEPKTEETVGDGAPDVPNEETENDAPVGDGAPDVPNEETENDA